MSLVSRDRSFYAALLALVSILPAIAPCTADSIDDYSLFEEDADVEAIARRAENSLRADHTFMLARATVRSAKGATVRVIDFECWNDRVERRSFIRVVAPKSAAGTAFLDLPPNLWHYEPELERTRWAPASARLEPWMDSGFAIADLIAPISDLEEHDVELVRVERPSESATGKRSYVLQYTPAPADRVDRQTRVAWIDAAEGAPLRWEFFAAGGERLRTIEFSDFRSVAGHRVPYRWKATAPGKKGRESVLEIRDLRFEAAFDDAIFTTENLEPARAAKTNR